MTTEDEARTAARDCGPTNDNTHRSELKAKCHEAARAQSVKHVEQFVRGAMEWFEMHSDMLPPDLHYENKDRLDSYEAGRAWAKNREASSTRKRGE